MVVRFTILQNLYAYMDTYIDVYLCMYIYVYCIHRSYCCRILTIVELPRLWDDGVGCASDMVLMPGVRKLPYQVLGELIGRTHVPFGYID